MPLVACAVEIITFSPSYLDIKVNLAYQETFRQHLGSEELKERTAENVPSNARKHLNGIHFFFKMVELSTC